MPKYDQEAPFFRPDPAQGRRASDRCRCVVCGDRLPPDSLRMCEECRARGEDGVRDW